ncbi:hypothetical protein [Oceanibaculum indicum]|uniref:Uncharacterized protein n=2 Tax=Oceanibaculum indicum TaxID=526216 RepID=K2KK94_9PROT|nr:hypothetical protein [Oceanibaculum indicum]EKE77790.1 hypothetical protein P24_05459 [Oceanibaculum indicum P24]RKQ73309.1 hypothetical protein BCL74_1095 [Oceanibaculum indicum]
MALTPEDVKDLHYSIHRMNSVAAVFRMRADNAMNDKFSTLADLIDLYVSLCQRSVGQGRDFVKDGLAITEEERVEANTLFERVFEGSPPAAPAAPAAAPAGKEHK